MESKSFKDLTVWTKSLQLVKEVYLLTTSFPDSEKFGLTNQIRRASVSIPANIAEGYGRNSSKERRQFIAVAKGSASELEAELLISRELGFIDEKSFTSIQVQLSEVLKMLAGLLGSFH